MDGVGEDWALVFDYVTTYDIQSGIDDHGNWIEESVAGEDTLGIGTSGVDQDPVMDLSLRRLASTEGATGGGRMSYLLF